MRLTMDGMPIALVTARGAALPGLWVSWKTTPSRNRMALRFSGAGSWSIQWIIASKN
jgi:hypothetical protein